MSSNIPSSEPWTTVTITKEEYFSFHNIDRQLFTRLVVGLGRDTSQSTHVMAFIMWLDKQCKDTKMLTKILQWPDTMLDSLADEAILILNCLQSSQFPYDDAVNNKGLPLIKSILQNNAISLKYLYDKRVIVISAVTKFLNNVCLRAFTDIVQQVENMKAITEHKLQIANIYGAGPYVPQVVYYTPLPVVTIVPHQQVLAIPTPLWSEGSSSSSGGANYNPPLETYDVSNQKEFNPNFNKVLAMLNQTSITSSNTASNQTSITASNTIRDTTRDENKEVPVDDRIIFMTFSKGYPITEAEVRDLFSRRYGDIIEALYMQDVVPLEQPLYARVVIRAEAAHMIDRFLESTNKVKLSINGKHAWARKYVPKSPKAKSPMTSRAPSPSSAKPSY
ncbi:hypothetical protein E2542_SST25064 [Spatholobus suberectus]|nr:hypothetical protein E2542_SST25064 [Spatholobus suberectus]